MFTGVNRYETVKRRRFFQLTCMRHTLSRGHSCPHDVEFLLVCKGQADLLLELSQCCCSACCTATTSLFVSITLYLCSELNWVHAAKATSFRSFIYSVYCYTYIPLQLDKESFSWVLLLSGTSVVSQHLFGLAGGFACGHFPCTMKIQ